MDVKVLFFARSRELAGVPEATVTVPADATTASLLDALYSQFPSLEEIKGSFALAVNQDYIPAGEAAALAAGDEVAVIPPISGG